MHLLSVLSTRLGVTVSQHAVDDKTNEGKAALAMLTTLVLQGRILTLDAADAAQVREYERHFYLAYARLADNKLVPPAEPGGGMRRSGDVAAPARISKED